MSNDPATVTDNQDSNQEFKQDTSSPTSLAASTGIEPPTPTEEEGEGYHLNPSDPARTPPPPPPQHLNQEKNSLKEKQVGPPDPIGADFFLNDAFQLADHFAGDEIEFLDENQRRQQASRFRGLLIKEFHSASAAERYPDPDLRLQACAQVVRLWIDIVQARDNPAQYIGFIATQPGMRALTQARKQVFGSADDYREIELDPTLQAMWREKYGDNWREKRQQELSRSTARAA